MYPSDQPARATCREHQQHPAVCQAFALKPASPVSLTVYHLALLRSPAVARAMLAADLLIVQQLLVALLSAVVLNQPVEQPYPLGTPAVQMQMHLVRHRQ